METEVLANKKIKTISLIVFIGIFVGLLRAYFGSYLSHDKYPFNTFLFDPADRFNDLFNMIKICSQNSPYITSFSFPSNYFPVANTIFYIFSLLSNKVILLSVFLGIFIVTYGKLIITIFKASIHSNLLNLIIIFFFSYPIFFNVDRLNIEIYNFLFCLLWLYFNNKGKTWLSIIFLSLSISLKLYTGVFVILYLKDKKYKETAIICLIVGIASLLSLITFKGGVGNNIQAMLIALKNFTIAYSGTTGLHYNLSLLGLIKVLYNILIILLHKSKDSANSINNILPIYTVMAFIMFLAVIFIIFKRNLPKWMNLFLLTAVLILFPNVSFDYKLIFIYLPLIYYLKEKNKNTYDNVYNIGFACLLIPHNYIVLYKDISIAVVIYPLIILAMSFLIIFRSKFNAANQHSNSII